MQLAMDETTITIEGTSFVLRPSLRAAYRLEQKYGGFGKLVDAMLEGNIMSLHDLICESSTDKITAALKFERLVRKVSICTIINTSLEPLSDHMANLMGVDRSAETEASEPRNPMPFAEYHTRLFKVATGWLGWTPEDAWNATPAEISIAFEGHLERLKAIHGPAQSDEQPSEEISKEEFKALSSKRIGQQV